MVRLYAGHLMTSLEMAGILVSVLKVTGRSDWLDWLDRPTAAPAWPVSLLSGNLTFQKIRCSSASELFIKNICIILKICNKNGLLTYFTRASFRVGSGFGSGINWKAESASGLSRSKLSLAVRKEPFLVRFFGIFLACTSKEEELFKLAALGFYWRIRRQHTVKMISTTACRLKIVID